MAVGAVFLTTFSRHALIFISIFVISLLTPADASTTYVVTSSGSLDSDPGTLPWAISEANNATDISYINFDIPGGSDEIAISLANTLALYRPMVIDATSQPGYSGQPRIRIDCNGISSGFTIAGPGGGQHDQRLPRCRLLSERDHDFPRC